MAQGDCLTQLFARVARVATGSQRLHVQDPGFIDAVVNKKAEIVRVYLPPDANCLLSVMDHCLKSRHYVNVVIAGKHPSPQWLAMDAAALHCAAGLGIWRWALKVRINAHDTISDPGFVIQ